MLVEIDEKTNKMKITLHCDDRRVSALFLGRRDLTINQKAFVPPGQVSRLVQGTANSGQGSKRFEDIHLTDFSKDNSWTGYFENNGSEITFVDRSVSFDHTYQYQVYGVDRFGNKTSFEYSSPVFVNRQPLINAPLNLRAAGSSCWLYHLRDTIDLG
jgi:hypothetical protein